MAERYGSARFITAERFNKPQEAIAIGLELQEYDRRGMEKWPEDEKITRGYADTLGALAVAYQATGEQDKAVQASEEAEAFYDEALKKDPGNLSLLADAGEATHEPQLPGFTHFTTALAGCRIDRTQEDAIALLATLDPANANWRYHFAMAHMMECYYLEGDGQIETRPPGAQRNLTPCFRR